MTDDVPPMIYVTQRVEAYTVAPESVQLIDIVNNAERYINKYVALKQCGYDYESKSLIFGGTSMLPIENLFGIELPIAKLVDIEGIIIYSPMLDKMAIAPMVMSYESSIEKVLDDKSMCFDINSLPADTRIYSLDGISLSMGSFETGMYIVHLPGQRPVKAIINCK